MKKKKKNKSKTENLFLETSVPRNLLFGHKLVKDEINKNIKGKKLLTSFYVMMEFKRSVIKTLIDFYFVVMEEDSVSDAFQVVNQYYSSRKPKVIYSAMAEFLKEEDLANDKEKFLLKLETLIQGAQSFFIAMIDKFVENKTQCPLAKASTVESYKVFLDQIECITDCSVESLWKKNKTGLRKLVEGSKTNPHKKNAGFFKPISLVESAIIDPSSPKSKTKCMKTGDFIIALEMPSNLCMLTFDRAFTSICGILGKKVLTLPSLVSLQKSFAS